MKPSIFISSTFYDLKYIREELREFIESYYYDPILSEEGDIGYKPGQPLDISCYETMRSSDMVILIIGDRYGSPASGEEKNDFGEYISVTMKEFRTAIEAGIPIFVMIDKRVSIKYNEYKSKRGELGIDVIEKVYSRSEINLYSFIKEIESIVTLPIKEFEKVLDIKLYLKKQWADMIKRFLNSTKIAIKNKKIESDANEIKNMMQEMVNNIEKKMSSKDNVGAYEKGVNEQEVVLFCTNLIDDFGWGKDKIKMPYDKRKKFITQILDCLIEANAKGFLNGEIFADHSKSIGLFTIFKKRGISDAPMVAPYITLGNRMNSLMDTQTKLAVVEKMTSDEYFFQLARFD